MAKRRAPSAGYDFAEKAAESWDILKHKQETLTGPGFATLVPAIIATLEETKDDMIPVLAP